MQVSIETSSGGRKILVSFLKDEFERGIFAVVFPVDFIGVDLGEDEHGVVGFLDVTLLDGRQGSRSTPAILFCFVFLKSNEPHLVFILDR